MAKKGQEIRFKNVNILFKNFRGEERRDPKTGQIVNREGQHTFCIQLDEEEAEELREVGLKISQTKPNEEYDDVLYFLQIEARFDKYPPEVYMYVGGDCTQLNEDTIGILDNRQNKIKIADVIINASPWQMGDRSGVKAYLTRGDFLIEEDEWQARHNEWLSKED
jgi:hypothetical protein